MVRIKIVTSQGEIFAELNNTKTAKKILSKMPIEGQVNLWGDEIYFEIPANEELEEPAKQEMEVGDLAYWPNGNAFCIFFGNFKN